MKILESYLTIAESLFIEAEIDDEEMIKYKDKDGESKEMKAGSAKTMDKEHPAKIEYDKMADKGGEEEPKGKGLGKGDFERDFDDDDIDPELDLYKKAAAQGMTPDQYKSMHGESGNESITIDCKKYRPIKESKQHKFKEIYDRTFRSLK